MRDRAAERGQAEPKRDEEVNVGFNFVGPDYFEAMVYYNLLYREKAKLQTDEAKKAEYTAKANEWVDKAKALRKKMQEEEKKKQADDRIVNATGLQLIGFAPGVRSAPTRKGLVVLTVVASGKRHGIRCAATHQRPPHPTPTIPPVKKRKPTPGARP